MSSKAQQKIDLNDLDLNRIYTFEEFEYINDQLKYHTFEINGQPVNLFELDKNGKLIPMPQATINMEAVVLEIGRQLGNWNIQTGQGGVVTSSQGGFNFHVRGGRMIRAPDVSFTSKNVYRHLTQQQLWTFKGEPFTPMVVIEVSDTIKDSDTNKKKKAFDDLDEKFKFEYFSVGTSVQLGWLIDPKNKGIWIYKLNKEGKVFRRKHVWGSINGGDLLPGFTLDIDLIEKVISQESTPTPTETSESEDESQMKCFKCEETFTDYHSFSKHYEKYHILKL
ncbi:10212_t:CDS:2 [Diversispora eburnea]|uniref:10212_t:CDS:1 n=1 Tax=Diversispora eburnea TaxID=1213867 RepID=A0A9N9GSW7_9GLOM|nr:10212_t:CDS:2 [Diversispora eburnea]